MTTALLLTAMLTAIAGSVAAQTEASPAEQERPVRRVSFGIRVRGFESDVFPSRMLTSSTTSNTSQSIETTASPRQLSVGPALEVNLTRRMSVVIEAFYHRPSYEQVLKQYSGTDDTSTEEDERTLKSTTTERTSATYWDFPVVVRYRGLKRTGILAKVFVDAGAVYRTVTRVATSVETVLSDNTNSYHENPTVPITRSLVGFVAGAGFRFIDEVSMKITPQVRYTHWPNVVFRSGSTESRGAQFEAGIGLAF